MPSHRYSPTVMVKTGTAAPTANAEFIGQLFVNTTGGTAYIAKAVGTGASDWLQIG